MREYIGARYVPTFANPVEWDDLRTYEALTIVTYNGTSYTSKKPVPVGINIGNVEYWAQTGNYNAQVEAYRQNTLQYKEEVDRLRGEVVSLGTDYSVFANKKILIYGDSISSYDTAPASTYQPNWVATLRDRCPETTTINNEAIPGMYMTGGGGIAATIRDSAHDPAPDYIVLFGGVNDFRHSKPLGTLSDTSINTFGGALNTIATAFSNYYPRAEIYVVSPLKNYETSYPEDHDNNLVLSLYRTMLAAWCNANGYNYIEGFNAPRLAPDNSVMKEYYQQDGLHPNNEYSGMLCDYIARKMIDCDCMSVAPVYNRLNISANINAGTVSFAYADIDSNGNCELIISGNVEADGTNKVIGALPEYLRPAVSSSAAYSRQVGSAFDTGIASVSNTTGEIKARMPASGTVYYSVNLRYTLAVSRKIYTNSR